MEPPFGNLQGITFTMEGQSVSSVISGAMDGQTVLVVRIGREREEIGEREKSLRLDESSSRGI